MNKNKEKLNKNWSRSKFLSSLNKDAKELFEIWLNSNGYSVKMTSYFSTYAELLSKFRKKKMYFGGNRCFGWGLTFYVEKMARK